MSWRTPRPKVKIVDVDGYPRVMLDEETLFKGSSGTKVSPKQALSHQPRKKAKKVK